LVLTLFTAIRALKQTSPDLQQGNDDSRADACPPFFGHAAAKRTRATLALLNAPIGKNLRHCQHSRCFRASISSQCPSFTTFSFARRTNTTRTRVRKTVLSAFVRLPSDRQVAASRSRTTACWSRSSPGSNRRHRRASQVVTTARWHPPTPFPPPARAPSPFFPLIGRNARHRAAGREDAAAE
ncbi:uncharacterized protein SCHCODRAFT_02512708, partial [Schizophyllum commune H4-8]|uniref:uncharacterized protein n=1 Tax=Schizophyllum commune (strain H4-8 / FGSC 9210) TaxID=578458 RepID=UPI00215ED2DD